MGRAKLDRSRRGELQRLLGDAGEVLPRMPRGTFTMPAQGWYARMADGELRFLGDHSPIAAHVIRRLADPTVPLDTSVACD